MNILVIGHSGQVAQALSGLDGTSGLKIDTKGRLDCDLTATDKIANCLSMKDGATPKIIINAAAYTAVDKAESEPNAAFLINRDACGALARACSQMSAPLIHISTDYVYHSENSSPLTEQDQIGPTSVYGQSKFEGEQAIRAEMDQYVILRTAWIFSETGNNFVKTMLKLAQNRDNLNVVADQFGNPTAANDIARGILKIIQRLENDNDSARIFGTYNFAGHGHTNWADFARAIFTISKGCEGPSCSVSDITSSEYPTPAKRPLNSKLDTSKFVSRIAEVPSWQPELERVIKTVLASGENGM